MASEKRLIDPNDFRIPKGFFNDGINVPKILDLVAKQPTIDAVEVVRCKDCKWYRIAPTDNVPYCCHESGYCGEHMGGLFFCACGERKDK